jgi:chromate transport protein ChrA
MESLSMAMREPLAAEVTLAPNVLPTARESLGPLVGYFLKLGAVGFGGPVALVGYMHRDPSSTAAIGLISLGVLWRFKPHAPIVVAVAGLVGLVLWLLTRGPA